MEDAFQTAHHRDGVQGVASEFDERVVHAHGVEAEDFLPYGGDHPLYVRFRGPVGGGEPGPLGDLGLGLKRRVILQDVLGVPPQLLHEGGVIGGRNHHLRVGEREDAADAFHALGGEDAVRGHVFAHGFHHLRQKHRPDADAFPVAPVDRHDPVRKPPVHGLRMEIHEAARRRVVRKAERGRIGAQ